MTPFSTIFDHAERVMKKRNKTFNVYLRGKHYDTVFYDLNPSHTSESVKLDLINHDGYPSGIVVIEEK